MSLYQAGVITINWEYCQNYVKLRTKNKNHSSVLLMKSKDKVNIKIQAKILFKKKDSRSVGKGSFYATDWIN